MLLHTLQKKKKILSLQKTNNFYYSCKGIFKKKYRFTPPKKIDLNKLKKTDFLIIIPTEIKNDAIIKNMNLNKIRYAEFNVKNIDILIENGLVENKLIKPLYLS